MKTILSIRVALATVCLLLIGGATALFAQESAAASDAELSNVSINGGIRDGKARLIIEGLLGGKAFEQPLIFSAFLEDRVEVTAEGLSQKIQLKTTVLQGNPRELLFKVRGAPEINKVTGDNLLDWSLRRDLEGNRVLVIRPKVDEKPPESFNFLVEARSDSQNEDSSLETLSLLPPHPGLLNGEIRIEVNRQVKVEVLASTGLIEVPVSPGTSAPDTYRLHGTEYTLRLNMGLADPEARFVSFRNARLEGEVTTEGGRFTLAGTARVTNPEGGSLRILSGEVALTESRLPTGAQLHLDRGLGTYSLRFAKPGDYPVLLNFAAKVNTCGGDRAGWHELRFKVAPAPLQRLTIRGLPKETQIESPGARPEWSESQFQTYLPADGTVALSWKAAGDETEGKLFYAADLLGQVAVSPGLMQQFSILELKIMQGELRAVDVLIQGPGEITRIAGENLLSWRVTPVADSGDRRLTVEFNQPQKSRAVVQLQMQTPLPAFPQFIEAARIMPEGATRMTGHLRVINEGAVRIEVPEASGLSQVSPEQFPETDLSRAFLRMAGTQRFAYRFAGENFSLKIFADQVLPEVAVSEVLAFRLGENDTSIDAEVELDIREAPLRELLIRIPRGYAVARLTASGLNDYFVRDLPEEQESELRLVYGSPVTGRQVVQLRLERNEPLSGAQWVLPRIEVVKAKSTRGHIGVAADPGYRLVPETTRGLTEIATAFFPRKIAGIQAAFRLSEPTWSAIVGLEKLPQTVQVDAMHLFSIGEGIAYGSSVMNYLISGAPVSTLNVELSNEYFNIEFSGKDIRQWRKTDQGYLVQLHTPVSGAYTLLATYERPFKAQGETLIFNGARPLDIQSEQGHTIVVSAFQFQVTATQVSPGLLPLEPGEVPPQYRLFFDAPVLAAYRYTSRPFNLQLALTPLAQGDSLNLVVDRATLSTRVSKEGQVLTDARYFVKNRGNPHFRVSLPADVQLWSVMVDGNRVVPVKSGEANLIPLPQRADPNAVLTVDLKLASRSKSASRVSVLAPVVSAPVMLAEWKMHPDTGRKLTFRSGSLKPTAEAGSRSGLAQWSTMLSGHRRTEGVLLLISGLGLIGVALGLWRWTLRTSTHRGGSRFIGGTLLGSLAFVLGAIALINVGALASLHAPAAERSISFLAPIQQGGTAARVEVGNVPDHLTFMRFLGIVFPLVLAGILWLYGALTSNAFARRSAWLLGWGLLVYQALRMENGAMAVVIVCLAFLLVHLAGSAIRQLWLLPSRAPQGTGLGGASPAAPATLALFAVALLSGSASSVFAANPQSTASPRADTPAAKEAVLPESVTQAVRVEEKFAFGHARIHWNAEANATLPLVHEPAVITAIKFPTNSLKLLLAPGTPNLLATEAGSYEFELHYQVQLAPKGDAVGFTSPLQHGLVNRMQLTIKNLDVEVFSPHAVTVDRDYLAQDTSGELVLMPVNQAWVAWRPRSRDPARETPVFYAESAHLYVPTAGVIEGVHHLGIRPAQGQLSGLIIDIPPNATVMDVMDAALVQQPTDQNRAVSLQPLWRFDPDSRELRLTFSQPQARPFALLLRLQIPSGPFPVTQSVGLLKVKGAARQIGSLAVATAPEVQLDAVTSTNLSAMNLEDFTPEPMLYLQNQVPGTTVRRAFRYSQSEGAISITANAVEADIRAETQQTVSIGEDRIVLVANAVVNISRAGIFKLTFKLPAGFDVETISGSALSHWTESKYENDRLVTLHLKGKTEGQHQFAITLAGAGAKSASGWSVPPFVLRETSKERGTLLLVPEQGMRLQPTTRENLTQLDPEKSGVSQKGVLAFRILEAPWRLLVDIEQVDAWVQVTSLQHVSVAEAQAKVMANLQYQIENTGLKAFRILIPANAENVRFSGEQVSDFRIVPTEVTNSLQEWEIKLHRKVIGAYRLQCNYQLLLPQNTDEVRLRGLVASEVNLQRGFVTIESGGRLQLRVEGNPQSLQPIEWQSIPQSLKTGVQATAAHYTFRLVEPAFELPLKLDRHEAAKLLPARVNSITLNSVIADDGGMLTQAKLEIVPGDKRLLSATLPKGSRFWFAFVNQTGVWPWREGESILIPLDQQNKTNSVSSVELFYSSTPGVAGRRSLNLKMGAPEFDLPLENITWRIALDARWKLTSWGGTMQLEQQQLVAQAPSADPERYLESEITNRRERTKQAENLLSFGNRYLAEGDPQQARRAFQAAFGLSTHDAAFNEDARVQLHNLKVQQALVGLNVLQAGSAPESAGVDSKVQQLRTGKEANYTQSDAELILRRNSADENAALTRLAERIVQQQDAVLPSPTAIRASIPEQGLLLTFKRSVMVDPQGDLNLELAAKTRTAGISSRVAVTLLILMFLGALARAIRPSAKQV